MKRVIISLLLSIIGAVVLVSVVSAATCEEKMMCIDDKQIGFQGSDCKIISASEFFDDMPGAKGSDTHYCVVGCKDGECINDNTPESCSDTDGGINYFVKGTATLKKDGAIATGADYCSDKDTLVERLCGKSFDGQTSITTSEFKCHNGCVSGTCIKDSSGSTGSVCVDSDGGKNINESGIISINGVKIKDRDSCILSDPLRITEYFCLADGTYASVDIACSGMCERGADGGYCTNSCAKSDGYYCTHNVDGKLGVAFLTKDCRWEKYAPCQSGSCGLSQCMTFGNLIDTDGDGLLDVNEEIWGTDPNKTDTDGDGFSDMSEIYNGYNPLGAGKLTPEQLLIKQNMTISVPDLNLATSSEEIATDATTSVMAIDVEGIINSEIGEVAPMNNYLYGIAIAMLAITILLYIYSSLCLQIIAKKLNISNAWLAWIPIANMYLMVKCADKPAWWFLVMIFIPIANIVITILVWIEICKRLGHSAWLVVLLLLVPIANIVALGYLAFSNKAMPIGNVGRQI